MSSFLSGWRRCRHHPHTWKSDNTQSRLGPAIGLPSPPPNGVGGEGVDGQDEEQRRQGSPCRSPRSDNTMSQVTSRSTPAIADQIQGDPTPPRHRPSSPSQNPFEMSSFKKSSTVLDLWSSFMRFPTNRKLSWMHLFLMTAIRLLEIISPKIGARRFARIAWRKSWKGCG